MVEQAVKVVIEKGVCTQDNGETASTKEWAIQSSWTEKVSPRNKLKKSRKFETSILSLFLPGS